MNVCERTNSATTGSSYRSKRLQGFTLIEFIIAIMMVSLFVSFASLNLTGLFSRNTFKAQVTERRKATGDMKF